MMGYRPGVLLFSLCVCGSLIGCTDPAAEKAKAESQRPKAVLPGPVDSDAPEEFTTTESGLKYRVRRKSVGRKIEDKKLTASVHYRGWLDDGTLFDSSYGTAGAPKYFETESGIPGWVESLKLVGEGGMIEVEIPPKLAYGEVGAAPLIPPNSTLHFLIEMVKLTDPVAPPEMAGAPAMKDGPVHKPGDVDADAPEEFTKTASGLKYRIRRKATGRSPTADGRVYAHYRGWLDNGSVFDTTYDLGHPNGFAVNAVIAGWTEGLQLTGEGGMIELEIPSELGYKAAGAPPKIPPNATLHFLIEIVQVQ